MGVDQFVVGGVIDVLCVEYFENVVFIEMVGMFGDVYCVFGLVYDICFKCDNLCLGDLVLFVGNFDVVVY